MQLASGLSRALGSRCAGCRRTGSALCRDCAAECRPCDVAAPVDGIDRVLAPWSYEGAARDLILGLKLRGRREAATPLVDAMVKTAQRVALRADVIAWVPGRRRDIRIRGYDHAELLARGVARNLGLPAAPVIRRTSDPPDQTALSRAERKLNLAGVFEGTTPTPERVAIVDDLVTTGATLTACSRALRATGATAVEALIACRA